MRDGFPLGRYYGCRPQASIFLHPTKGLHVLPFETIQCPYCGETIDIAIDDSVDRQQYVEDCQVCCRPIKVVVSVDEGGGIVVQAWAENEA